MFGIKKSCCIKNMSNLIITILIFIDNNKLLKYILPLLLKFANYKIIFVLMFNRVNNFLKKNKIPPGHDIDHCISVLKHLEKMLKAVKKNLDNDKSRNICNYTYGFSEKKIFIMKSISLLHDVDDSKYFKTYNSLDNAKYLLSKLGLSNNVYNKILYGISCVSTTSNKNNIDEYCNLNPYLLFPRWADRLECIGYIGIYRCLLYTKEKNKPLYVDDTPRVKTIEELEDLLKNNSLDDYKKSNRSYIDHFYEKLFYVAKSLQDINLSRNSYVVEEAKKRTIPMTNYILSFGNNNSIIISEDEIIDNLEY